ncbi:MAG: hypothetical protein AAF267_19085 [Deinococcota bacterium]
MEPYPYSWITEGIVVATWAFAPWLIFVIMRESGRSLATSWLFFAITAGWAILAWLIVRTERLTGAGLFAEALPLIILISAVLITTIFAKVIVGQGLNQRWLIGLQLFRAIGMVFVLEWSRGNLPAIFALPAGWGDLATALVALAVLLIYRRGAIPKPAIYTVAAVGILDAISAFFFGFLSSPTNLQLFAFDQPNQVAAYPTGLIPYFLITFAVLFHILSLTEAQRATQVTAKAKVAA